jgi:Mn2+/Fe2+ NRAMP family transporter
MRINIDTWVGMALSDAVAFFIMLSAAATLHAHHVEVKTKVDAASARKPIAGEMAFALFSLGIVGTGLLASPVLAGSAAHATTGAMKWRNSLALQVNLAKPFYAVVAVAILGGVALIFESAAQTCSQPSGETTGFTRVGDVCNTGRWSAPGPDAGPLQQPSVLNSKGVAR